MDRAAFLKTLKVGVEMNKLKVDRNKNKYLSKEQLILLSKEELVNIVIQLQASNLQLKNVIAKKNDEKQRKADLRSDRKKTRDFDYSRYQTRRIFLRIAYLGGTYKGLAVQDDSPDTIEAHLFRALEKGCLIKSRAESSYHRCGRTDKGVSASGQIISIEVRSRLSIDEQLASDGGCSSELLYCKILNRLLPQDIRAVAWLPAPMSDVGEYYSARFDCKQRTYKYWFPQGSLDLNAMSNACERLQGSGDFRNLCKMDVANGVTAFIRHVKSVRIVAEKPGSDEDRGYSMHYFMVTANAFLWHQIRCMAGILFLVGAGYEDPSIISELLDVKTNPRKPQYNMAIDLPLNLFHCAFEFLDDYEEKTTFQNRTITPDLQLKEYLDHSKKHTKHIAETTDDVVFNNIESAKEKFVEFHLESKEIQNFENHIDSSKNLLTDENSVKNDAFKTDLTIEEDSLLNDLSCKELDAIEEQFKSSDAIEKNDNEENNEVKSINFGVNDPSRVLTDAEPMQHSDDENMALSGKFELKKDWWKVDLEDLGIVIKNFQAQWTKSAIQASMIRDIIEDLEGLYSKELSRRPKSSLTQDLEAGSDKPMFLHQTDSLLQGVTPKIYQPLLKRTTCESLENRIEHYVKKKRLRMSSEEN